MTVDFAPEARTELLDAVRFYEDRHRGLGDDFAREIREVIKKIVQHPLHPGKLTDHTRQVLLKRFPYGVVYRVKSRQIRIIAIAHLRRRPRYWKGRD